MLNRKQKKLLKTLRILRKESQKGSLLTELMIGLLISVLTVMVVLYIFTNFENQKKATTQVSEAVTNNALTLFPLQTNAKMAGFGFNDKVFYGCNVKAHNSSAGTDFSYNLRPVEIASDFNGTSNDRVIITLGSADNFYSALKLMNNMSTADSNVLVNSRFGLKTGDILLFAELGKDCTMVQVTDLPTDIGRNSEIAFSGSQYTWNGQNIPTTFNKTGAHGIVYTSSALIANFGRNGKRVSYFINDDNELVEENSFNGVNETVVLGNNVVAFKVIYGLDTNGDKNVDSWSNVTPSADNTHQIIGLKYALISRSAGPDGSVCNVTNNSIFNWAGGNIDVSNTGDDWGCYRYRMIQGTAPLKNMLWADN